MKEKKRSGKLGWLAVVLWVVGFALAFVIAPGSPYIWLPDGLLLLGFWPLLIANRCRWLWLVFGLFNTFIGFVLLVVRFMPDSEFSFDPKVLATKTHLGQYHEPFTWMILGIISAVVGAALILIGLVRWMVSKSKKVKA
ncbi:MAG: hypothetical protein C5B53_03690 [Candidatus Melainabacteria bacterium]|nr:MAG: hypothetical protein C5B53_03690 [Candidatus Melainabacteria bacterium]